MMSGSCLPGVARNMPQSDYKKYPELWYVKKKKVCTQWLIPYKKHQGSFTQRERKSE